MSAGTLRVRIIGDAAPLEKTLGGLGKKLGMFAAATGAAAAAATGFSIKKFADFDQAMQQSVAIMGDVSDKMRGDMSDAAREVAKTTVFSAEEAAESYFFLASAGLDAAQSIEALPRVAAFAQAGNFDMARATDLLTDSQSALGLASDDAAENLQNLSRVGDVLVKANTLANASVEQFSEALTEKAGNALQSLGKDVEEGVAVLSVFADQGIKGSAAGTMLTNTLEGLTRNARNNAAEFENLGVQVFNADGTMRGTADIVRDLEGAMGDMSVEEREATLAKMGFNKQALTGIKALLGNSDALDEYESQLREAGGTVDEVAGKQLETFHAQLGLLKDQFLDVALSVGEQLMPHIMRFVEALQKNMPAIEAFVENALRVMGNVINNVVVPAFQTLSDWWSTYGPIIVDWAGRIAEMVRNNVMPVLAAMGVVVAAVLVPAIAGLVAGLAALFSPVVLVVAALAALAAGLTYAYQNSETFRKVVNAAFTAVSTLVTTQLAVIRNVIRTVIDWATKFWDRWGTNIVAFTTRSFANIRKIIDGVMKVVRGIVDTVMGLIRGDWTRAFNGIRSITSGAMQVIRAVIDQALNIIRNLFPMARAAIMAVWSAMWSGVRTAATTALSSLVSNISNRLTSIVNWFRRLPGRIVSAIGNVGKLLSGIGRQIMDSLFGGFREKWNDSKQWLSDLGGQIRNLKGPIEKDRKLLTDIGEEIIGGLGRGMDSEWAKVEKQLGLMTAEIPLAVGAGSFGSAGTRSASRSSADETNRLLRELLAEMRRGGDVYLDGNKVGTSLVQGIRATQGGWR